MMRRRLCALTILALLALASPAAAFWNSAGAGAGSGAAGTLDAVAQPTAGAVQQTVTVSWAQTWISGNMLGSVTGGGYTVKRYSAAGGAPVTPGSSCAATITGAAATLTCEETSAPVGSWRYTVTPGLNSWTGPESTQSAAVDVAPPAPALTSVTAQNPTALQTTGDIQIVWGSVSSATGYNLYRRAPGGTYDFSAPVNGSTPLTGTSYTDPGGGLLAGTTYAYVVRAVAGTLRSTSSGELSAATISRPAAPTGPTATAAPAGRITVGWSAASGVAGYNVYRRTSTGSYDYTAPLNGASPTTGTTFSDVTAINGTTYRYVVRAVNTGAGGAQVEGTDSAETAAATSDATVPTSVTVTDPGSPLRGTVTISGTATDTGSGIASVRFQLAPTGTITWTDACTDTTAPYSCSADTTAFTDGFYDVRALATDAAGNTTTSTSVTSRRIDNTGPAVTMGDPGAYLRGTLNLTATATDAGTGTASVRIQYAPTGSSTWTDVCTDTTTPYACAVNTTTVAAGGYDMRAIATDVIGNTTTSAVVANRIVDNTAPRATDIQTANVTGGTAGKPEAGDTVTYTFSESTINPSSILSGWTGTSQAVTVRFSNANPDLLTVWNSANTAQLPLGTVAASTGYVTAATTFTGSTMVKSGNTITITLGTPSTATATGTANTTLQWTPSATLTDLAGNPMTTTAVNETGTADKDF